MTAAPIRLPLDEERRRDLAAAADRILPGEDGPGATDADVITFLDWALLQPSFAPERECLLRGLAVLDSVAAGMWDRRFAECGPAERDAVLTRIQSAPHPTAQRFLSTLVDMTLAGFLCHPRRGGNRDGIGWRFIDFKPHPFTWGSDAHDDP